MIRPPVRAVAAAGRSRKIPAVTNPGPLAGVRVLEFAGWNGVLAGRLLAFLRANKDAFEKSGFIWRGDAEPVKSDKLEIPEWLKSQGL